jgi:beta-glucosidase
LLKRFLANENENDRISSSLNFDPRLFHHYYSVPLRMAIDYGGAQAFMTAYNSVNGVPMMVSPTLKTLSSRTGALTASSARTAVRSAR